MTLLRGQRGFTLVELLVVMLVAGLVAAGILGLYISLVRSTADKTAHMQDQDSARTAVYSMSRYIRAACSSDSNMTSVSDSLLVAGAQEFVFYVDLDSDGTAERVRYYLSDTTLRMQTAEPDTSVLPATYPEEYGTDSIVIMSGIRNGADPVFTYYGCDEDTTALYGIPSPDTEALRRAVVAVGIRLAVNEKPEITHGAVELTTRVQIRQRYDGGLSGS